MLLLACLLILVRWLNPLTHGIHHVDAAFSGQNVQLHVPEHLLKGQAMLSVPPDGLKLGDPQIAGKNREG